MERGGEILMWFGVDILGNEPWTIAVREMQKDGKLLQTAVGDINVEQRRMDTSETILLDAK